jgi:4-hydroxybenzoate polyprenyltransferase
LVGLAYGAPSLGALFSPLSLALFAYFLLPANVFLYGINDVFDADADRVNPKKDDRERRYRGKLLTPIATAVSAVLGVGLLLAAPAAAVSWLVGFFALGAAYSAPPLRLKVRPPLDSISNGLYILPGAAAYAAMTGSAPPLLALVGGWLWTMAMHTFSAVPDVAADRRAGLRTLATTLGERGALAYCGVCWLLAAAALGAVALPAGLLLSAYPLLVVAIDYRGIDVDRAYWWFPVINVVVGAMLTMPGLIRLYV